MKLEKRGARRKVFLRQNTNKIYGVVAVLLTVAALVPNPLFRVLDEPVWQLRFLVIQAMSPSSEIQDVLVLEGAPPADSAVLADVVAALSALEPKVIGVDLPLGEFPSSPQDAARLVQAVEAAGNVVIARQVAGDEAGGALRGLPKGLDEAAARQGYSVLLRDEAGTAARSALYDLAGDASLFGWPVALVQAYLGVPDFARVVENSELVLKAPGRPQPLRIPLDPGGAVRVHAGLLPRIPRALLADLQAGNLTSEMVKDRIVLLPGVAPETDAELATSLGTPAPRSALQAAVVAGVLRERVLAPMGAVVTGALLLALALLVGIPGLLWSPGLQLAAAGFGLLSWWSASVALLGAGIGVLPLAAPHVLVLGLVIGGALRYRYRPLVGVRIDDGQVASGAQAALSLGLKLMRDGREEEALKYFQKVAGTDGQLRDRGATMLALVLLRKGDRTSVSQIVQTIDVSRVDQEEAYELASHLQEAGEIDQAHTMFSRIANTDVTYRDVRSRLMDLRDRMSGFTEDDVANLIARKLLDARFRDTKLLGRGGMGFVFRCNDAEADGREVAVKVLSPFFANQEEIYRRFIREARSIADFRHPRIIEIYEVFEQNLPYYSMEFLSANSIKVLMAGGQKVPLEQALHISIHVCEGLAHAHKNGVTHRDIKPDNIMLDSNLDAKVIDFGIAHFDDGTRLTNTGATLGTPLYMSPEQVLGNAMDNRSDIFSYGIVMYEMLVGERPFAGMTTRLTTPAPRLDPALGLPEALADAVAKALETDAANRFATFDEFRTELVAIQEAL